MIKKLTQYIVAASLVFVGVLAVVPQHDAMALDPAEEVINGINSAGGKGTGPNALGKGIEEVVNILLFVIGTVAVIMLVVGGLRYTLSGGDQTAIKAAKDTILYSLIGIVVALLAFAIVKWLVNAFI